MTIETKRLGYFIQVAESGSLSKASQVLHIAQPALSRQIHILEDYLGFTLFNRTGRGMQLTREGRFLRDGVVGPLRDLELAVENMRSFMSRVDFAIGIGVHSGLSPVIASPLIAKLQKEFPSVKLRLLDGPSETLVDWLKKGTIDFALLDSPSSDESLSVKLLAMEALMLVSTKDNNRSDDQPLPLSRLENIPLVLPCPHQGTRKVIDEAAKQQKTTLNIAFETDSPALMIELARAGRGALLVCGSLANLALRDQALTATAIAEPIPNVGAYLATRSYGEIEGSLISKIDSTIQELVIDLLR